jgi:hypothetical protein
MGKIDDPFQLATAALDVGSCLIQQATIAQMEEMLRRRRTEGGFASTQASVA